MKHWILGAAVLLAAYGARAGEVRVAAAADFVPTLTVLAQGFEKATGNRVLISMGSTGKLYAQISNGAPFDVFLSADAKTPKRLVAEGFAVNGSRFTYAVGRLVLWSALPAEVDAHGAVLARGGFSHLAIANPATAPYGAAARQVLAGLGLWHRLAGRIVDGENVGQTFQFVASGNAELGFVALAQVRAEAGAYHGSYWQVPQTLYRPLRQQAVLLTAGAGNPAAVAFYRFLRSAPARSVIEAAGYGP
ncbi:MAG: molybdate ABC transporter substrate-binding protein [Betaproteobacteria bacterium]|nr:molybdate ABC transporter substrate-binding protein [Betaproteobacteria bacterium]